MYPNEQFTKANAILKELPKGDLKNDHTTKLPVFRDDAHDKVISEWRVNFWERIKILFSGKVWLGIIGRYHPPVFITGENPFDES